MEQPWADVDAAGEWLLDLESRLRPDLVHLNDYRAWRSGRGMLPSWWLRHSCVFSWWNAVHGGSASGGSGIEYRRRRVAWPASRRRRGRRVCHERMLRELQRWYGVPSGAVVYNGHSFSSTDPSPGKRISSSAPGALWDAAKNIGRSRCGGRADRLARLRCRRSAAS